ncbi:fasciclin domain-containing protein [Nonomuraea sp. NPDC050790]|uniref:fasciclin domain-containing protein n=1 Tax=Nonomuraea sp. NPDC050790 TaxID=3364371 RepID=UPI00378EE87F
MTTSVPLSPPNPAPEVTTEAPPESTPEPPPETPEITPDDPPDPSPDIVSPPPWTPRPSPRVSRPDVAPMGCDVLPDSGPGSRDMMAGQRVVGAMSGVPELSTFVSAINHASYAATLDTSGDITVFAPVNSAFDKLPEERLNQLLGDPDALIGLLGYHVVDGRKTPADLEDATLTTRQTGTITTTVTDDVIRLNNRARVLCPNIQTSNATVYLINTVLKPPS